MDNNKFDEELKEQLEKEIEELKRQKEIKDLQRQKEELEKIVFGDLGVKSEKQEETTKRVEKEPDEKEIIEGKYISNRMTTILAAVVALVIVMIGSGIFYLRSQNKKKKENLKKEVTTVSQNQNIPAVTKPQTAQTPKAKEQKPIEQPKLEQKKDKKVQESNEKLIVRAPITVKKGSYCMNPNVGKSSFDTDTVEDPYAVHEYMADVSFQDCVINDGSSAKHTGPVTVTVSLAEEKNYNAVMSKNKWYLENGQVSRISGYGSDSLYFNGWLMYKQSN